MDDIEDIILDLDPTEDEASLHDLIDEAAVSEVAVDELARLRQLWPLYQVIESTRTSTAILEYIEQMYLDVTTDRSAMMAYLDNPRCPPAIVHRIARSSLCMHHERLMLAVMESPACTPEAFAWVAPQVAHCNVEAVNLCMKHAVDLLPHIVRLNATTGPVLDAIVRSADLTVELATEAALHPNTPRRAVAYLYRYAMSMAPNADLCMALVDNHRRDLSRYEVTALVLAAATVDMRALARLLDSPGRYGGTGAILDLVYSGDLSQDQMGYLVRHCPAEYEIYEAVAHRSGLSIGVLRDLYERVRDDLVGAQAHEIYRSIREAPRCDAPLRTAVDKEMAK